MNGLAPDSSVSAKTPPDSTAGDDRPLGSVVSEVPRSLDEELTAVVPVFADPPKTEAARTLVLGPPLEPFVQPLEPAGWPASSAEIGTAMPSRATTTAHRAAATKTRWARDFSVVEALSRDPKP